MEIRVFKLFLALVILCSGMPWDARAQAYNNVRRAYNQMSALSSKALLEKAENYLSKVNKPDSALLCLTIVTHRYKKVLSKADKINVIGAYNGLWFIMFFTYFDYAKSFEALMKAKQIAEEMSFNQAQIHLNFGCFYQTLAEECKDRKLMQKAFSSYRMAFREGLKSPNSNELLNSFGNLVMVSASLHCMDGIKTDWQMFRKTASLHSSRLFNYTSCLYQGLLAKEQGHYDEALTWFRKQGGLTDDISKEYIRNRILMYINIGQVLSCQHKNAEAAACIGRGLDLSRHFDLKDCKLQCYELLADYHAKANRQADSQYYLKEFYQLKDTLLNYQQLASVKDIQFLSQINTLDEQISRSNLMNTVKNYIIIFCAIVVAIIILLLIELSRRNKRLRQNNEMLYRKNVEMLELEQREKKERKEKSRLEQQMRPAKYSSTPIGEDAGRQLMARIRDVMDSTPEVYSPDFSLGRLAQLAGEQTKKVSQVINQFTGGNFNVFVNDYRIKEACKRINDKANYGNMSLEGIALSVGFRSTNTFRAAFKRVTGLYPSKYLQLSER